MSTTTRLLSRFGLAGSILCGAPMVGATHTSAAQNPTSIINGLGGDLQVALSASTDGPNANLVFSPFSVGVALTMASAGANGETAAQMNDVLGITMDDPHSALALLIAGVEENGGGTFSVANSLWTQSGMSVADGFNTTLADNYGAELQTADFASDPAAAVDDVNGWVTEATADRIPTLLTDDQVNELTRFILVNAVHLDAEWQAPFDPESTNPDDFTRGDGSVVEVDFMGQTLHASYAASDDAQAIALPYTNGYEMVIVLPSDGGLAGFEQSLAAARGDLDSLFAGFVTTEVDLELPKWDIDTTADLVPQLQSLGMELPFDPVNADFSNLTPDEPLFVSAVVHQANITVDEQGTEAAAATAVIGPTGAEPGPEPDPVEMDIDHPFFFAIRDTESGAVLFQGHINDPGV